MAFALNYRGTLELSSLNALKVAPGADVPSGEVDFAAFSHPLRTHLGHVVAVAALAAEVALMVEVVCASARGLDLALYAPGRRTHAPSKDCITHQEHLS
jgi:hypothetical protein